MTYGLDLRPPEVTLNVAKGEDFDLTVNTGTLNLSGATVKFVILDSSDVAVLTKDNATNGGVTLSEASPGSGVFNVIDVDIDKAEINALAGTLKYVLKYNTTSGTEKYIMYGDFDLTVPPGINE